jgi:hypothetical protein
MRETSSDLSLWRSSGGQAFFLIGEPDLLPPGPFRIVNGEDRSLSVTRESLEPFVISRDKAIAILDESVQKHAESIIRRKKELQLLGAGTEGQGSLDPSALDRVKTFFHSEEAKTTVRSLTAALRKAADKIERSPADIEKSIGELFSKFTQEMDEDERTGKEKGDEERKQRIGIAVRDSIANSLRNINKQ